MTDDKTPLLSAILESARRMYFSGGTPNVLYICQKSYDALVKELTVLDCRTLRWDYGVLELRLKPDVRAWYLATE